MYHKRILSVFLLYLLRFYSWKKFTDSENKDSAESQKR